MEKVNKMDKAIKSYWIGTGKYQDLYNDFYDYFVPTEGESNDKYGELLRSISRITYDYYNNGWGNDVSDFVDYLETHKMELSNYLPKGTTPINNLVRIWGDFWEMLNPSRDMDYYDEDEDEDGDWMDSSEAFSFVISKGDEIEKCMEEIIDAVLLLIKDKHPQAYEISKARHPKVVLNPDELERVAITEVELGEFGGENYTLRKVVGQNCWSLFKMDKNGTVDYTFADHYELDGHFNNVLKMCEEIINNQISRG